VHLDQEDLHDANLIEIEQAGLRLGISTHSYWELAHALAVNLSYIALEPIFETTSKSIP
jgi:hydroxymethylpyrimidine kinase/phosphomethylpyrimidine kinase/thiamine-phosphate diphosphorylase